jgi:hypothetical protein
MAAPTPSGASHITMPTSWNITSLRLSQSVSIAALAAAEAWASATAKAMAKVTIGSDSFPAAASNTLRGTACSSTPARVGGAADATDVPARADVSSTWTPGRTRFTTSRPTTRASVVTTSK